MQERAVGCVCPPELVEIVLVAAADGDTSEEVLAHLALCPACAARASAIEELQRRLRQRLYRMFCPTSEELTAWLEGRMACAAADQTATHLESCPHCQSELAMLREILAVPPARTPASALRRVVAYQQRSEQLVALDPALALNEAHVYRAGMLRIVLTVERLRGLGLPRLRGSLCGNMQPGLTASLLRYGRIVRCATLDQQGVFTLADLSPGTFSLSLRLRDYEVVVEALEIA